MIPQNGLSVILELSGTVQMPENSLFQWFIFFMVHLSNCGRTKGSQDLNSDS